MIDSHIVLTDAWGVRPILFSIGSFNIYSYETFVLLALIVAGLLYYWEARRQKDLSENTFFLALAALVGGALGAKIPIWIMHFSEIAANINHIEAILSGRTIVGGLIGGTLAVMLTKRLLKIKTKRGNLFAPAIAAGIAVGRIGCFLRGCCFGIATNLPWGVDFGDGVKRHPTEIYEIIFASLLFVYIQYRKRKPVAPGYLFKLTMASYFTFRFFLEFIKYEQDMIWGLTIFQILSLLVIVNVFRENVMEMGVKFVGLVKYKVNKA